MERLIKEGTTNPTWYSTDNDWVDAKGNVIAVWTETIIRDDEYKDFTEFILDSCGAQVEPIGSFVNADGLETFVFTVLTEVPKFSIWRFKIGGMRWWYDMFWETNGGQEVHDEEMKTILSKLGLEVRS
jgi:hypothetical protein